MLGKMMKILIIEDEPRAVRQLQTLLKHIRLEYQLLDIIDTVEDSIRWFQQNESPDLVLLDIQLADGLSFEIFQEVQVDSPIIFTTAFDQYAIQAFKVNSIDYLLKPVQASDLSAAIDQFKKITSKKGIDPLVLNQLLSTLESRTYRVSLLVKQGSSQVQLKVEDLLYMYSEDSLTFGVTADKRYLIDETMDHLFQSLDPTAFFRINRGQIVARDAIIKVDPYFNHRVKLVITHQKDQEFIVSRGKTREFKEWLNS